MAAAAARRESAAVKSAADFGQLREEARLAALEMIGAACRFVFPPEDGTPAVTEEELAQTIGSRSYLSGLPDDDPRNTAVSFLLPPQERTRRT